MLDEPLVGYRLVQYTSRERIYAQEGKKNGCIRCQFTSKTFPTASVDLFRPQKMQQIELKKNPEI